MLDDMISRRDFAAIAVAGLGARALGLRTSFAFPQGTRPRPTPAQLRWQREELSLFVHFGVNTFTDREWGDGKESPTVFNPTHLDARQWARAAKDGGFRSIILTAKHHDGFCLWPTKVTEHSVKGSPWRDGAGDVVREMVDACRAEGLGTGVYCSPWDRNAPVYGDSPRYNDFFCDQLTELLTQYGPMVEVWFDGANGEGPNGKKQEYDWPRFFGLVKQLQPEAVIFSDAGPDVRWCGNEKGSAGDPNWATVDPAAVPYPGAWNDGVSKALQHGDPRGAIWRPAETNTSIRPGWFYHPAEDTKVKSVDELTQVYFTSVGRNSKLLLNVPPGPDGLFHANDVQRMRELRERIDTLFATDVAAGRQPTWRRTGATTAEGTLDLERGERVETVRLEEPIQDGQVVARYRVMGEVDGTWRDLSQGTTIGFRKLDRFEPVEVRRVRVIVEEALAAPPQIGVGVYSTP
jgi:alpha-L-fucosidase